MTIASPNQVLGLRVSAGQSDLAAARASPQDISGLSRPVEVLRFSATSKTTRPALVKVMVYLYVPRRCL